MRRPLLAPLTTIAAAMVLAACSSSYHTNEPSPSSSTTASSINSSTTKPAPIATGPRFVSLIGPPTPVQCNSPTSVRIQWETRGASRVSLSINGASVFASYTNGPHDELEPLACDGTPQVYKFVARSADGRTATKTLTLTVRAST